MERPAGEKAELTKQRLRVFQVAFDQFNQSGEWPGLQPLTRRLVKEMDVLDVLDDFGHPWIDSQDSKVVLRLPAIALCDGSQEVLDAFMVALKLAVKEYFDEQALPELTQAKLVAAGLTNLRAHQALKIYRDENLWSGVNGNAPGNWTIQVDNRVRPFENVSAPHEYIQQKYGRMMKLKPLDGNQSDYVSPIRPATKSSATTPLIFLSHSGSSLIVRQMANLLNEVFGGKVLVWTDAEITGGKWAETIREKLKETRAFVLVATPPILTSVYVGFETGYVDAALGQHHIFVLRAGVDVAGLQSRPPLAEYQSYDATQSATLADFCRKLALELGLTLDALPDLSEKARRINELVAEEAKTMAKATQGKLPRAKQLINDLEQQFQLARNHSMIFFGAHLRPEVEPFDVDSCKAAFNDLFEVLDDHSKDAMNAVISRLRNANALLAKSTDAPAQNGKFSPAQYAVADAARHLRDPLVAALAQVRRNFNLEQPPAQRYPQL